MPRTTYSREVFINCPFAEKYEPMLGAAVFAVFDCGFRAHCAKEIDDSSVVRIDKLFRMMGRCMYGIHDISWTKPDGPHNLPRFNMPLELGMFLGAKRYGRGRQKRKRCLILDRRTYSYQKYISDIAGQDIRSHKNTQKELVKVVRNWLRACSRRKTLPGAKAIYGRWKVFKKRMPAMCEQLNLEEDELIFVDFVMLVSEWIAYNPIVKPSPN